MCSILKNPYGAPGNFEGLVRLSTISDFEKVALYNNGAPCRAEKGFSGLPLVPPESARNACPGAASALEIAIRPGVLPERSKSTLGPALVLPEWSKRSLGHAPVLPKRAKWPLGRGLLINKLEGTARGDI